MSGTVTPRSTGPKVMTSRLMSMKFMQRAASSSPLSSTPVQTPGQHSAKRQKISSGAATPTSTGTPVSIASADNSSLRLPWNAAGETEWVLNLAKSTTNGHNATAESSDEDELWSSSHASGRQSFGSFKRRKSTLPQSTTNGDADLSELELSDVDESMHPLRAMKRPRDREEEEEAHGRRLDRMEMSRMEGISGSSSMSFAGMSKRKEKEKYRQKTGRGPYGSSSDQHRVKKRKTM